MTLREHNELLSRKQRASNATRVFGRRKHAKVYGSYSGWCVADVPLSRAVMTKRFGREASRAISLAMIESVDDIGAVTRGVLRGELLQRWSEDRG
jgi:hypothetical protein